MRSLLLSDLILALPFLLDKKGNVLDAYHAGMLYGARLDRARRTIDALPRSIIEGRPLADELLDADAAHDDTAQAIWHYTEAILRGPGVPANVRAAAERVRASFIPDRAIVRASYATEAANASEKRKLIPDHVDDFYMLPVVGDRTIGDWVEAFVDQGDKLLALLQQRSGFRSADRSGAGRIRMEAIGLLYRLRGALGDELADDPDEHARVDAELFAFIDQLASDREASQRRRASTTSDTEPQPEIEPPTATEPEPDDAITIEPAPTETSPVEELIA